eukprot:120565-Pelagomonas_calceolata.AAC.2
MPFHSSSAFAPLLTLRIYRVLTALPAGPNPQGVVPGGLSMADGALALTAPLLERARAAAQAGVPRVLDFCASRCAKVSITKGMSPKLVEFLHKGVSRALTAKDFVFAQAGVLRALSAKDLDAKGSEFCASRCAKGTSVRPEALKTLAEDLRLLASALRFMDAFPGLARPAAQASQDHPALKVGHPCATAKNSSVGCSQRCPSRHAFSPLKKLAGAADHVSTLS